MHLGIDFGTTNSAAAIFEDQTLVPIRADDENENPFVLPSLIYIDRAYQTTAGRKAALTYLERETGRPVKWERRFLGVLDMLVAGTGGSPIHVMENIYVMVDVAANGRLLQSIKSALRDPNYEGTYIFNRFFTLDELIAIVLGKLKARAEAQLDRPCTDVTMGRPVKFSDDPAIDARAEEILYKAARWAGFTHIAFELEPIGVSYLHHISSPQRHTALIFDFGGGTLDLTIARLGGKARPEILATRGVLVGGDDLDMRLMQSLLKHFGEGITVGGYPFPHDMLDLMLKWQTMPELSRPQHMNRIREFRDTASAPKAIAALETLVSRNVGYKLFTEIERTKKALSTSIIEKLAFKYGAINIREVIARNQFEDMVAVETEAVEVGIHEVLKDAEMAPTAIDTVLRTGGSSLVPAFIQMLTKTFGEEKVQDIDPLVSVVGGLAIAAQEARAEPAYAVRYEKPGHTLISSIQTSSGSLYESFSLRIGAPCYTDNTIAIIHCPIYLSGLPAIRTAGADRHICADTLLSFELSQPARIYVGYEAGASRLPAWLETFENAHEYIDIKGEWVEETSLRLYTKDLPAGTVTLGGSRADGSDEELLNYLVVVRAAAQPA